MDIHNQLWIYINQQELLLYIIIMDIPNVITDIHN